MKKQLDYKSIAIGILFSFGMAGFGYGVGLAIIYLVGNGDLECDKITMDDYQKSRYHNEFTSFDDFKNGCYKWAKTLKDNAELFKIVLPGMLSVLFATYYFILFGIYKHDIKTK